MARKFKTLRNRMSPERQARSEAMARKMMADMLLAEIRKQTGLTQVDLAQRLGITQPSLSKLEAQDDMQISTLRRIVEALDGELELTAKLPGGKRVSISQFAEQKRSA
ncbi:MAG: XRE family transcriptional regulator [Phycisphaeraceae bacterium]|nr:XRE family transcriptional regulator [Phycisphaeraceae bacterium]